MKKSFALIIMLFSLSTLAFISQASSIIQQPAEPDCEMDVATVMEEVGQVCTGMAQNHVCYGKVQVNAVAREEVSPISFNQPGDNANLSQIQSIYLSALDLTAQTWGIAQMRLLATTGSYPRDLTLLLFGNVEIEGAGSERAGFDVTVNSTLGINIRNTPSRSGIVLGSAAPDETLHAVGRLDDSKWIRIEETNGRVGWVLAKLVTPLDSANTLETLVVDNAQTPYYSAMQAFYFESTASGGCGSLVSDGLLIQTPNGLARVTVLINEVSIELLGAESGATAFVQSNSTNGLTLDMLKGSANVTAQDETVVVDTNRRTTVPMNANRTAMGRPSQPEASDLDIMRGLALLPLVEEAQQSYIPPGANNDNDGNTSGNGNNNGNANGNSNGNSNGASNGSSNGSSNGNNNGGSNGSGNGNNNGSSNGDGGGDDDDGDDDDDEDD